MQKSTDTQRNQASEKNRYGRPQNIRVLISSYLTDMRESQQEKSRHLAEAVR
ncbi:MAG: hypothetical protein ACLFOZ_00775 [Cyclobacteriaceae bacterium]